MTLKLIYENNPAIKTSIDVGPRVRNDIKMRIRELHARLPSAMTSAERRELHKLVVFMQLLKTGDES